MKKSIYLVLGVIGVGLLGYSVVQGWASWTQSTQFGMGIAIEPVPGYKYWQGITAGILGLVAFLMLFKMPKVATLPALAASGLALWLYMKPPLVDPSDPSSPVMDPQKAILFAIAGGVVLALAGLVAPKRA
jgi:hypothetical protein